MKSWEAARAEARQTTKNSEKVIARGLVDEGDIFCLHQKARYFADKSQSVKPILTSRAFLELSSLDSGRALEARFVETLRHEEIFIRR